MSQYHLELAVKELEKLNRKVGDLAEVVAEIRGRICGTDETFGGGGADQNSTEPEPKKSRKYYRTKLPQLIEEGVISVGTQIVSTDRQYPCEAEIADKDGTVQILRFGKDRAGGWKHEVAGIPRYRYGSLSAAIGYKADLGSATENRLNGWQFWALKDDPSTTMADVRAAHDNGSAPETQPPMTNLSENI